MSQDDSDSSEGDSSVYTITNVLLGYASKEPTNDSFSQLGGIPVRSRKRPWSKLYQLTCHPDMARYNSSTPISSRALQDMQWLHDSPYAASRRSSRKLSGP